MEERTETFFKPTNLDILIAVTASLGLPVVCGKLYDLTGALIPMAIYYGIFCWGIVIWRKGTSGYRWTWNPLSPIFGVLFVLAILIFLSLRKIIIPVDNFYLPGFLLTLFVWAPVNAFSEQLSWLYVFDAFANRFEEKKTRIIFICIGLVFYTSLIALIHILFWAKFLVELAVIYPYWHLYIGLHYPLTLGYIIIYRKTKSMYPVAVIHFMLDAAVILGAKYSIVPYLFK